MTQTGILKAEGVCKSYGSHTVLTGLDLTIEPGKIYGLIGRNGAGKTTLLGILTAQNTMDSGRVTYDGQPVWENQQALDQLCFSRELQPTLFTGQNTLKIKRYLQAAATFWPRWDREYAQRLLEEFRLDPKQKICQLSKGQMSMVTILLALASRAPITILDEPVAGLDVVARERFYQLLLEDYAQTGRTFLISTHIIEEAASVFERVIILDEGRIIENSPTDELVDQFRLISGHEDAVEQMCQGLEVLSTQQMGRHRSCVVRGASARWAQVPSADVDVSPLNLQKVFVALCGHGDEQR
jgi:ABC-2 type transport system ATP-binding protein